MSAYNWPRPILTLMRSQRLLLILCFALMGCGSDDPSLTNPARSAYDPLIEPANFAASTIIDNQYLPQTPGTIRTYEGDDERVIVSVLAETHTVMGIECVVVHDASYEEGTLVEESFEWYAQDNAGNVWYFGEDSREIKRSDRISTRDSWEAGLDGALPGIVMLANPISGIWYRREYYAGEAEDLAQVLALDEVVVTPLATFTGCLKILETDALEPGVEEHKWYASGVGLVAEVEFKGGSEQLRLVSLSTP